MSRRVVLMAVDGLDWTVTRTAIAAGRLPNLAALARDGVCAEVNAGAAVPGLPGPEGALLSPVLWTTVATGQYYFQHGVTGFVNTHESPSRPPLFGSHHVRSPRLWDILGTRGMRSIVVGYYVTHPAYPIEGALVSDMYGEVESTDAAWPPELVDKCAQWLGAADYATYVQQTRAVGTLASVDGYGLTDAGSAAQREHEIVRQYTNLSDDEIRRALDPQSCDRRGQLLRMRLTYPAIRDDRMHQAFTHLIDSERWDFATVYYRLIDFVSHGFWATGHPPESQHVRDFGSVVARAYDWIDVCIGEIQSRLGPDDRLIVLSDHGFKALPTPAVSTADDVRECTYAEHAEPAALLVGGGPRPATLSDVTLLDIAPTILDYFGIEQAASLDGGPVPGLLRETVNAQQRIPAYAAAQRAPEPQVTREEESAVMARLAALGYLEKPAQ